MKAQVDCIRKFFDIKNNFFCAPVSSKFRVFKFKLKINSCFVGCRILSSAVVDNVCVQFN